MKTASAPKLRLLLLVAVALGLWFFRDSFTSDTAPAPKAKPARATAGSGPQRSLRSTPPEDVCTVPTALPARGVLVAKARANPFVAPPPPPVKPPKAPKTPPVVVVAAPVAPPAPAPLPPPKLPYTYIGQFVDPGRPTTVFLNVGNALIHANPGDTLDGGFRLESIGAKELVFVHVQRNVTLRMPIEGERL